MSEINQNNCNVISLRPLEVTCNPTNATSPETQDGSIQLFININLEYSEVIDGKTTMISIYTSKMFRSFKQ